MDDLAIFALFALGFLVGLLVTWAAVAALAGISHGLVLLALRAPGRLGKWLRAWERRRPGHPAALVFASLLLGLVIGHGSGLLWRLLRALLG